jgi:hypothetical protein
MDEHKSCGCACHKMKGGLVVLLGLNFLLLNLGVISAEISNIVWPVLLILVGLKKAMGGGMCKCCKKDKIKPM